MPGEKSEIRNLIANAVTKVRQQEIDQAWVQVDILHPLAKNLILEENMITGRRRHCTLDDMVYTPGWPKGL